MIYLYFIVLVIFIKIYIIAHSLFVSIKMNNRDFFHILQIHFTDFYAFIGQLHRMFIIRKNMYTPCNIQNVK